LSLDLTEALEAYMHQTAPQAQLRGGDYAREKGLLDVTVVLSNFGEVDRIRYFYERSSALIKEREERELSKPDRVILTEEAGKDIPSLL
jgi:hypothetical protein